jgi:flagellar biosynthesis/type III secretory pathway protein FliH
MMSVFDIEYSFKTYIESEKREAEEIGRQKGFREGFRKGFCEGRQKGLREGRRVGIKVAIEICKNSGASFSETVDKIASYFGLSEADAEAKVKEYWNQ